VSINAPKAAELAKNSDLNPGSIYNYFAKRHAISTNDLPEIIDEVIKKIPVFEQQALHRKIVRFEKATDYKQHDLLLSIDDLHVSLVPENHEVPVTPLRGMLVKGSIDSRRIRLVISRQALLSGQVTLADLPMLLTNAAMRDEAQSTYSVLEANANLPDGLPLFGADNTATGSSLFDISAALTVFRNQKAAINSSELAYLEPKFL
jgi:AcrR family transcriptional regulator